MKKRIIAESLTILLTFLFLMPGCADRGGRSGGQQRNEETGAMIKHAPGYQVKKDATKNSTMKFRNPFRKKDSQNIPETPSDEIISDYKTKEKFDKSQNDNE